MNYFYIFHKVTITQTKDKQKQTKEQHYVV